MDTPDQVMASSRALLDRRETESAGAPVAGFDGGARSAARARRTRRIARRLTRVAIADASVLLLALVIGLIVPLGLFGALFLFLALAAVTVMAAAWPDEPRPPAAETLRAVDLKALPEQTGRWLAAQRPALPAPARALVDQIGVRLDTLAPQLAALDAGAPAGDEVRKLVAEQLPEFVRGYQRVPATLRAAPRNGRTPDAQLTDGLALIDRQLGEMSVALAQGDLDALATRGRYLEIRYRGDGEGK